MLEETEDTEETRLLLSAQDYGTTSTIDGEYLSSEAEAPLGRKAATPLPLKQLTLIFSMRLPEPIAYYQVIPVS